MADDVTNDVANCDFTMPKTSKYAEKCKPSTSSAGSMLVPSSGPDKEQIVQTVVDSKALTFENLTRHEKLVKLSKKANCQVGTRVDMISILTCVN